MLVNKKTGKVLKYVFEIELMVKLKKLQYQRQYIFNFEISKVIMIYVLRANILTVKKQYFNKYFEICWGRAKRNVD